jgi:hypothetical protein
MGTNLCTDSHSWWDRKTKARHFREIGSFAAQQPVQAGVAVGFATTERVDIFFVARFLDFSICGVLCHAAILFSYALGKFRTK